MCLNGLKISNENGILCMCLNFPAHTLVVIERLQFCRCQTFSEKVFPRLLWSKQTIFLQTLATVQKKIRAKSRLFWSDSFGNFVKTILSSLSCHLNMYNRAPKRPHSPETDNDYRGGFRPQPFHKRQRGENYNQPQTIEEKIARLGYETGYRNSDIGALSKEIDADLMNKVNEEQKINTIITKICKSAISYPTRVSTYATLIGLISVKHYNISCQIINTLHASYPVYLEAQKWKEAITIIHLLSCLVNCRVIRPSALLSQFELLLETAQDENVPQSRCDYFLYTVLSSLPHVALELSSQTEPNNFDQILTMIETCLSKRSKQHLNITRVWNSTDSTVQMDYLDSLWVQIKNFRANGWNENFLHRPYNDKECKDIMASSLVPQNSPTIQIPAHSDNYLYPSPRIVLRIFEDDVAEGEKSIPGSDKIERFCIENHIRNVIDEQPNNSFECARHLSKGIHRSDQLPMKYILIETLLGELFTVPKPRHDQVLYQSLLYQLSKQMVDFQKSADDNKSTYDHILNEAVKVLYENLESMNVTCMDRFINWFSYHLNSTNFLFPWQCWTDATCKDIDSPKTIFVQAILDRCIRFSYHKKIETIASAHLANLIPPEVQAKYQPFFTTNPTTLALENSIRMLITTKADPISFCETLNIQIEGVKLPDNFAFKDEKPMEKLIKIDIFMAVLLSLACKSLTHISSALGKYKNVIKSLVLGVDGGQVQLLQTMYLCLDSHPQLQVILVDKLLKAELVGAREICLWIFSEPMRPNHIRPHLWEILNSSIDRISLIISRTSQEKEQKEQEEKERANEVQSVEGDVEMKPETTDTNGRIDYDAKIERFRSLLNTIVLDIYKMFADTLGDHIRRCEENGTSYIDNYFRWMIGRMQQFYFEHYESLQCKLGDIKNIIDQTPSIGNCILNLK